MTDKQDRMKRGPWWHNPDEKSWDEMDSGKWWAETTAETTETTERPLKLQRQPQLQPETATNEVQPQLQPETATNEVQLQPETRPLPRQPQLQPETATNEVQPQLQPKTATNEVQLQLETQPLRLPRPPPNRPPPPSKRQPFPDRIRVGSTTHRVFRSSSSNRRFVIVEFGVWAEVFRDIDPDDVSFPREGLELTSDRPKDLAMADSD